MSAYEDLLRSKVTFSPPAGIPVHVDEVGERLKPHQADIVRWAIHGGTRAIFADFGLGKTPMQVELMRLVGEHHGGRQLIVCPLGVRPDLIADGHKINGVDLRFARHTAEVDGPGVYLTNYESIRDGRLDPALFNAVSLDEAAILVHFGSATSQRFQTAFGHCRYRFVATATPAPNEYRELFEYAHFLGVMDRGQAMTRFCKRDSSKANNLTLLPNMEDEFWLWVASWAVFLTKPSDLGHSDDGYLLPDLDVAWHEIPTPAGTYASPDRDGQGRLVRDSSLGVVDAAREKRDTLPQRLDELGQIIDTYAAGGDLDQLVVWVDLNDEQRAVERLCKDQGLTCSSIYGGLDDDEVERRLTDWREGRTQVLCAKPVMLGEGVNLQRCNKAVFLGVGFRFRQIFQGIHRIQRYGQTRQCHIHFVHAESERTVVDTLQRKWAQHNETRRRMAEIIAEHGLSQAALTEALTRAIGVERIEMSGDGWTFALNDTVQEAPLVESDSVGLVVTSIPFGNLYEYSENVADFGHNDSNADFWAQMDHLTPQLYRMLQPGRIYACHVKDRIVFGNTTGKGYSTVEPFHADAIRHTTAHGFDFAGMIVCLTDVVRENNQSYRLGWSEQCKDGSRMGVGTPEYVLLFRKPQSDRTQGYADVPVVKDKDDCSRSRWQTDAHAFWRSSGNRHLTPEDFDDLPTGQRSKLFDAWTASEVYDYELHVRIGEHIDAKGQLPSTFMCLAPASWHPDIWHDIVRIKTRNTDLARRGLEQHVCPMPWDIVDRLITRFSNPGDLVYDPFGGVGTTVCRALHLGRQGRAVELNPAYFADAVRWCQSEEARASVPSLFDLLEGDAA